MIAGDRWWGSGGPGAQAVTPGGKPIGTLVNSAGQSYATSDSVIRHDAGSSAAPYVAGTLLAARHVRDRAGLRRGLDQLLD